MVSGMVDRSRIITFDGWHLAGNVQHIVHGCRGMIGVRWWWLRCWRWLAVGGCAGVGAGAGAGGGAGAGADVGAGA